MIFFIPRSPEPIQRSINKEKNDILHPPKHRAYLEESTGSTLVAIVAVVSMGTKNLHANFDNFLSTGRVLESLTVNLFKWSE